MAWEPDKEESYRRGQIAKNLDREIRRSGCNHKQSKQLVGNFLVCKCGKKFIYRIKG